MPKLRQQRKQHAHHGRQGVAHLRTLWLPLVRRAPLGVPVRAMLVAVRAALVLHRVHGDVPTIVSSWI